MPLISAWNRIWLDSCRYWHDWKDTDYDQLAGALVSGHLIECSAYVTGKNILLWSHSDMLTLKVVIFRGSRGTILRISMSLDFFTVRRNSLQKSMLDDKFKWKVCSWWIRWISSFYCYNLLLYILQCTIFSRLMKWTRERRGSLVKLELL